MGARSSGILMPVSSLPSPYGIGTFGKAARDFVDFLAQAKQTWWQVLPLGPTSYGDSPYQSLSAFAGNPYFIDLDMLIADGLLTQSEVDACDWGSDPTRVDYGTIYENRFPLLRLAKSRGWERDADEIAAFVVRNDAWLPDYALFMALKRHFGMQSWTQWEDDGARLRKPEALEHYRTALRGDIEYFTYLQFLFFRQWDALRAYAKEKGVRIMGDLPIYVAMDSADVWADPKQFQLDDANVAHHVAGVPPDPFSADGQLWGNPLYDWDAMARDDYAWWVRRVEGISHLYDAIRIDHFRGLESYWAVPAGAASAMSGSWVKGPGMALLRVLTAHFPEITFIAEDLGYLSPEVRQLLSDSGFPGMKVLQFAFDSRESSNYFPHTYPAHSICYTGTHDNTPLMGWVEEADPADLAKAKAYLGLTEAEGLHWGMIRGGMSSVSDLFVAQMQDFLGLGTESRMNTPGVLGGNWQWRMAADAISPAFTARIAEMTTLFERD